jgi:hypothetical protein
MPARRTMSFTARADNRSRTVADSLKGVGRSRHADATCRKRGHRTAPPEPRHSPHCDVSCKVDHLNAIPSENHARQALWQS